MNFRLILNIMGYTLWVEAGCLLLPLLVSAGYGEACWEPFLWTLGLCSLCGLILTRIPARKNRLQGRDGYTVVAMAWIVLCLFGAVPYVLSGAVPHYADALFETASGLTTTGATILTDVEAMPRGILFWRALTQWMGGMGVLVLATAILPSLGVPSHYLTQAESPGPVFSKLVPKQSQTSKILYTIYFAMTSLEVVLLKLAGMPLYDAFIHAFSTAGTGGFSNRNASVGAYGSPVIDMIIAVFALLFTYVRRKSNMASDTVIGVFSSTAVALGIFLSTLNGRSFTKFNNLLIGDILSVEPGKIGVLALILVLVIALWVLSFNQLMLSAVHPALADSRGIRVFWQETVFSIAIAVVVTLSMTWVGLLVINSLLVLPAAAARNVSRTMFQYHLVSLLGAVLAGIAGLMTSYYVGSSAGAAITLYLAVWFLGTFLARKKQ